MCASFPLIKLESWIIASQEGNYLSKLLVIVHIIIFYAEIKVWISVSLSPSNPLYKITVNFSSRPKLGIGGQRGSNIPTVVTGFCNKKCVCFECPETFKKTNKNNSIIFSPMKVSEVQRGAGGLRRFGQNPKLIFFLLSGCPRVVKICVWTISSLIKWKTTSFFFSKIEDDLIFLQMEDDL